MNNDKISIDEEFIQHEAECAIHRKLTKEEFENVSETIWEGLSEFVYYKVLEVINER